MTKIPFLDLKAQSRLLAIEIAPAIQDVIDRSAFAGGPFVTTFETAFAAYCGHNLNAVGVGSGTEALWLPLLAKGIGLGDEVITVPNSFIATAEAITYTGATPVFVDVDPQTYTMNPAALAEAITERTKAIIPVHLFGQTADMDSIREIADIHGLFLLEDACQAHGAIYKGKHSGSLGDAAAFSFYPGKNLGAFGEAGAIVTGNDELAQKLRILRDHGQSKKYLSSLVGWNARMDGIQAAVLSVKLRYLNGWNIRRRANAAYYDSALGALHLKGVVLPFVAPENEHVYHVYALRVPDRDGVIERLTEAGIGTGVHYPVPIHLQEAYAEPGVKPGSFPVTEQLAKEFLSLPMYPELTTGQLETIVEAVEKALTPA